MPIIINNQQDKVSLSKELKDLIKKVVETIVSEEKISPRLEVGIILVDDEEIKNLNKQYRDEDKVTDVLSFAYQEDNPANLTQTDALGDIVISLERGQKQAKEYGHSLQREVGFLVTHGMYHILGYNHLTPNEETAMRAKEEKIMALVSLTR